MPSPAFSKTQTQFPDFGFGQTHNPYYLRGQNPIPLKWKLQLPVQERKWAGIVLGTKSLRRRVPESMGSTSSKIRREWNCLNSDFWVAAAPVSIAVVQVNFKVCSRARSIGDRAENFAIIRIWRDIVIWDLRNIGQWAWWRRDHAIVTIWSLRWRSRIGEEDDYPQPNPRPSPLSPKVGVP